MLVSTCPSHWSRCRSSALLYICSQGFIYLDRDLTYWWHWDPIINITELRNQHFKATACTFAFPRRTVSWEMQMFLARCVCLICCIHMQAIVRWSSYIDTNIKAPATRRRKRTEVDIKKVFCPNGIGTRNVSVHTRPLDPLETLYSTYAGPVSGAVLPPQNTPKAAKNTPRAWLPW